MKYLIVFAGQILLLSTRHLAASVEPLHDDEVDHEPGHDEGGQQLPLHPAQVRDALSDPQHAAAAQGELLDPCKYLPFIANALIEIQE